MSTETQQQTTGLEFPCECKGCRGYSAHLDDVWTSEQIPSKIVGHYFSEATRRFHKSRIVSFRHLENGALAVRESCAGDMDNTYRIHRVVVFCRYGVLQNYDIYENRYTTGAKAANAMRAMSSDSASTCDCHGCQLDRAGR